MRQMERPRALDFHKDYKANKAELKRLVPFANAAKAKMDYEDFMKLIDKPRSFHTSQNTRSNGYHQNPLSQRLDENERVFDHDKDDSFANNGPGSGLPCTFKLKDEASNRANLQ